jgi:hypothetical protein
MHHARTALEALQSRQNGANEGLSVTRRQRSGCIRDHLTVSIGEVEVVRGRSEVRRGHGGVAIAVRASLSAVPIAQQVAVTDQLLRRILDVEAGHLAVVKTEEVSHRFVPQPVCLASRRTFNVWR